MQVVYINTTHNNSHWNPVKVELQLNAHSMGIICDINYNVSNFIGVDCELINLTFFYNSDFQLCPINFESILYSP